MFRLLEFNWFYCFIYIKAADFITEELYQGAIHKLNIDIVISNNLYYAVPPVVEANIISLYDMFNLDKETAIIFVKRFYTELVQILQPNTLENGKLILESVIKGYGMVSNTRDNLYLDTDSGKIIDADIWMSVDDYYR